MPYDKMSAIQVFQIKTSLLIFAAGSLMLSSLVLAIPMPPELLEPAAAAAAVAAAAPSPSPSPLGPPQAKLLTKQAPQDKQPSKQPTTATMNAANETIVALASTMAANTAPASRVCDASSKSPDCLDSAPRPQMVESLASSQMLAVKEQNSTMEQSFSTSGSALDPPLTSSNHSNSTTQSTTPTSLSVQFDTTRNSQQVPPSAPPALLTGDSDLAANSTMTTTSLTTNKPLVAVMDQLVLDPSLQVIASETLSPRSDKQHVLEMFNKFFLRARSHDDQQQKELVRDGVILRLRDLGFQTSFLQKSRFEFRRRPAFSYNMISILPGKHRQTKRDRIVLIGAHWDSATKAPGVDDNGSGSTCLLEIARLISENKCAFNHTVMLVWFDYEEQGKYGSEFFVNDYLFPLELEKYGSKFIGAYILDMILVRDKENNTQTLPLNLKTKLADFSEELEREKFRGDFLATWSRRTHDEPLEGAFRTAWTDLGYESRTFKAMRPELPQLRLPNAEERYEWKDFFRSDHASFWFPPLTSTAVRRSPNRTSTAGHTSLNAILLTDLGPWRKSYQKCYHAACDDEHLLTDGNLAFMQQVIDSLVLTLLRVGQGECTRPVTVAPASPQPVSNLAASN